MKTQKGITLIALIITIIVLLILAVVSIHLVVGNLTKVSETKIITAIAIPTTVATGIKKLGISFSPFHYLIFKVPFIYL